MARKFIEERHGASSIAKAKKQQDQLSYFTQSDLQEDITQEYIKQWADRNYATNDEFLNWVKTVFRTDNFLSFYKYFRSPLASARLVNDRIIPQLQRVFFAEDSHFNYTIDGQEVQEPEELNVKTFNEWIFNAFMFRHNDIVITDLKDVNEPFREIISIDNVVSIDSSNSVIHRLAYTATVVLIDENGEAVKVNGFLYMDAHVYAFYDRDYVLKLEIPHDLGECPADYISKEPFSKDDVVRKSIYSYIREQFEEYVFLKTLQRMTEPNGAIPIVTQLKTGINKDNKDRKGETTKEPMASNGIGGQQAFPYKEQNGSDSTLQTGTIVKVPMIKKDDGSLDMDAVKNFLNFFFIPVESLDYLNKRIGEIEDSIIEALLGNMDQNKERKNELQVKSGFVSAEDKIRSLSLQMSRLRKRSDFKFLALQHGKERVTNDAFYGSDFFLESQSELYGLFEKSPNPLERRNILLRTARNRNRFNPKRAQREVILYHLMPYAADKDFDQAVDNQAVDAVNFQYQTRFNYWIGVFEAEFGDILLFWESMGDDPNSTKLIVINNIITNIITALLPPPTQVEEQNS